jgi:integrase
MLLPRRKAMASVVHRAALPYRQVGAFMVELKKRTGTSGRIVEFQILTAARSGEVVRARWDEIDMAAGVRTIPGDRTRRGREHRAPLNDAALAVLERQATAREGDYIFSGRVRGQPIGIDSPMQPLQKPGYKARHMASARRSATGRRSRPASRARSPEGSLAHITGDTTERAYRRCDFIAERRQIMEAWAWCYIATPAPNTTGVVGLARR